MKSLTKTILYYTDNRLDDDPIGLAVRSQLQKTNLPIVSVSLKPIPFGLNLVMDEKRGYLTMARQILLGLEAVRSPTVFFCEHDVLYHPSHFDFTPSDSFYFYNVNIWKVRATDGHALYVNDCKQLSGLCANRNLLVTHFRKRVERIEKEGFSRKMGFEPGTHNRPERIDDVKAQAYRSTFPNLDIRHDKNLTQNRWTKEEFRNQRYTQGWRESNNVPGWGDTNKLLKNIKGKYD